MVRQDVPDGSNMEIGTTHAWRADLSWTTRLVLVVSSLALVAILAVTLGSPYYFGPRIQRNESAAIALLKNLSSAQAQFQAGGQLDEDGDGIGEFGFASDLVDGPSPRSASGRQHVPVLSEPWRAGPSGYSLISGYRIQVFLPGPGSTWVTHLGEGHETRPRLDTDRCEVQWLAYAWPDRVGETGIRAFLITHGGDLLSTGNADGRYFGDCAPDPGRSGFVEDGSSLAAGTEDALDEVWVMT